MLLSNRPCRRLARPLPPDPYSDDRYNLNFDAGHASSFWLRRSMEGAADDGRSLVEAALQQSDPQIVAANAAR